MKCSIHFWATAKARWQEGEQDGSLLSSVFCLCQCTCRATCACVCACVLSTYVQCKWQIDIPFDRRRRNEQCRFQSQPKVERAPSLSWHEKAKVIDLGDWLATKSRPCRIRDFMVMMTVACGGGGEVKCCLDCNSSGSLANFVSAHTSHTTTHKPLTRCHALPPQLPPLLGCLQFSASFVNVAAALASFLSHFTSSGHVIN